MREARALREPRRPRGVLHVDDLVEVAVARALGELAVGDALPFFHELGPGERSGMGFRPDHDNGLEVRKRARRELAGLRILELRGELVDHLRVLRALEPRHEDQRLHLGVLEPVLELMRLVRGVHRDEDRPDERRRELRDRPFGMVRRPYGDAVPLAHAERDEALRRRAAYFVELAVRVPHTRRKIDERLVVGIGLRDALEHMADRFAYERLFGTRIGVAEAALRARPLDRRLSTRSDLLTRHRHFHLS